MTALRLLHRWIGLALALPMLVQALTGLFMLLSPPFDDLARPEVPVADVPAEPLSAIIQAAREAVPANLVPIRYQTGGAATGTASIDFAAPSQRFPQLRLFIDPVSLTVLGEITAPDATYRLLHQLHETFLLPGGRSVVGWCGIGLLVLALTGIPIWWPRHGRWRAALTVPAGAKGYRLQRALHGAAGGWVVLLLALQALSGATMAFPQFAAGLLGVANAGVPRAAHGAAVVDLDAIAETLETAVPHASLVSLRFPTEPNRPMMAALQPDTTIAGPPVIVFIDPASHRILSARDPRAGPTGASLLAWLRTLHEGAAFGWPWRGLVAITGLALVLFPITGCGMWLLRHRNRRRIQQALPQGAGE
jgi:uncharacterized iron-regulated membrane protein